MFFMLLGSKCDFHHMSLTLTPIPAPRVPATSAVCRTLWFGNERRRYSQPNGRTGLVFVFETTPINTEMHGRDFVFPTELQCVRMGSLDTCTQRATDKGAATTAHIWVWPWPWPWRTREPMAWGRPKAYT